MNADLWTKYPLLNTMMKLRMARFNAAERLATRFRWQSVALVVFSIYVIALSIIPNYFGGISETEKSIIGFASVVSSVFVVALSVYSAFSEDVIRAKYLHDNAKRVTNLYHQYKLSVDQFENKKGKSVDTERFERKYASIMDSCPYNHDQIDYHSIRSEIEKLGALKKAMIQTRLLISTYFWPVAAIIGPPLVIAIGLLSLRNAIT
ncbi:SLATT domain-containing protein [Brevundimonas sp.]|uniref:SLATT domain-containing protein n=1 Tax=Brevundimonas sp. TaxID=1871086 RepID=UPI002FCC6708